MLRRTYAVLATSLVSAALVGCQANGDFNPLAGKAEETPTELAAYSRGPSIPRQGLLKAFIPLPS